MSHSQDIIRRRRARRRSLHTREVQTNRRRGMMVVLGVLMSFAFVGISVVAAATMYAMQRYDAIAETVVPAEELIDAFSRGGARVYDRNGVFLYEFVDRFGGLRRPVSLNQISEHLIAATIATEDHDFYQNNGLNVRGLARAGVENFTPFLGATDFLEGSGGSSITQQLAKNIYIPPEERGERSIDRKVQEMVIALELTDRYSKDQILEWYLNSISYGGIYVGIEAAAEGYFGKSANQLTLAEAALLAGLPQSPAEYYPLSPANLNLETRELLPASITKARQGEVLDLMVRHEVITTTEAENARNAPLRFVHQTFDVEAPHFIWGLVEQEVTARWGERALYEMGLEITTTIDLELNYIAEEILERNIVQYGEQAGLYNAALMAMDPHTGQILSYVASRDFNNVEILGENDNIRARNSPGSTLKPFTFLTAMTKGWGTGTGIMDTPVTFQDGAGGTFTPRNPGTGFQGPVPVSIALGNSFNITANKAMEWAGVSDTIDMLRRFGYTTLDNPGGYGVALTTGGGEISLFDQTIAYSVLATGGIMRGQEAIVTGTGLPGDRELEPVILLRVETEGDVLYEFTEPEERRIINPAYPYMISHILNDPQNTCITYGACGALALANGYPSAAKTGTSEPFEEIGAIGETWTMGYTPELVAGTWAGNSDNARIYGISSTSVSSRSWNEFMVAAIDYLDLPATSFSRPDGVVDVEVCWPSGRLPTDDCPDDRRYTSMFAAEVLPGSPEAAPDMYDSWWQTTAIDWRTGRPAGSNTPSQFIREGVRLVLPEDEARGWNGLSAWAARNNVGQYLGGGATDPGGPGGTLPAQIMSPSANQVLSGLVDIRGRVSSPELQSYRVEYGSGTDPGSWNAIGSGNQPVQNGSLTQWNTTGVPDGEYTIRVVLDDAEQGSHHYQIPITVRNQGAGPGLPGFPGGPGDPGEPGDPGDPDGGGPAPGTAYITSPGQNANISGQVSITGSAETDGFVGYNIQYGAGNQPASWTSIAQGAEPVVDGLIATWDTSQVPDGVYTLRLLVINEFFLNTEFQVTVVVANGGG